LKKVRGSKATRKVMRKYYLIRDPKLS